MVNAHNKGNAFASRDSTDLTAILVQVYVSKRHKKVVFTVLAKQVNVFVLPIIMDSDAIKKVVRKTAL
jgi:hypothetical protein